MGSRGTLRKTAWLLAAAAALAVGGTAAAADLERGEELYDLCTQCHGETGAGSPLALAPAIAGFESWYVEKQLHNFRDGARGVHPEDVGGLRMHPMSLSLKTDADIADVSAFVASLPAADPPRLVEGGDPARGAQLYATCAACHGPDGAGNQTMNAPALRTTSDWYLVESLHKYKQGIRGANPKNPNGLLMRGMAVQLADRQAMKDVVAYIKTLEGGR